MCRPLFSPEYKVAQTQVVLLTPGPGLFVVTIQEHSEVHAFSEVSPIQLVSPTPEMVLGHHLLVFLHVLLIG